MSLPTAETLSRESKIEYSRLCIQLSLQRFKQPIVTSKFGPDSAVFLHLITSENPDIPVIWIDSGHNSAQTLEYIENLTSSMRLNLKTVYPRNKTCPIPTSHDSPEYDQFVTEVKLEPFQRILDEVRPDVWFSSLRRYQTDHRAARSTFEQATPDMVKALPFLDWTPEVVEMYRHQHNLAMGPDSIDPTKLNVKSECGLHTRSWSDPTAVGNHQSV